MQDSNSILAQAHTSDFREYREFQRFILIRHTATYSDRGRIKDVGVPVEHRYAIWGKIRTTKKYEDEKITGVYTAGKLIFEYAFPMKTYVPQVGDYIEAHGVVNRQPRQYFLVKEIFPDSSIKIGKCVITPIGGITFVEGS